MARVLAKVHLESNDVYDIILGSYLMMLDHC